MVSLYLKGTGAGALRFPFLGKGWALDALSTDVKRWFTIIPDWVTSVTLDREIVSYTGRHPEVFSESMIP